MTSSTSISGITVRDYACLLLPTVDYESQLLAIRELLDLHSRKARARDGKIAEIAQDIPKYNGWNGVLAENEHVDLLHMSVYEDAAHSMAAIGMLAPFIETIFSHAFQSAKSHYSGAPKISANHPRWQASESKRWDCRWFYQSGGMKKNVVEGILELSSAIGLSEFLPKDLHKALQAVFEYRNKMLHHGFEWPLKEREKFRQRARDNWPQEWFSWATRDGDPWICYMTDTLINGCLTQIDQILDAIGQFVMSKLPN